MAELTDIRETVRERYANAAKAAASGAYDQARALESASGCCTPGSPAGSPRDEAGVFGASLDDGVSREDVLRRPSARHWAVACLPQSRSCATARRCWTSVRGPALTC
jgi:hypothetical protein